jgi:ATP-dependent helicase/nuclease subunit A
VNCVQGFASETFAAVNTRPYEREKVIQVQVGPVLFEGTVDAFDSASGLVLDYKTDRAVHPEHHLTQLALYAHHLGATEVALAYLRPEVQTLHVFTPADLQRGWQGIEDTVHRLSGLDFAPTPGPGTCRLCAF